MWWNYNVKYIFKYVGEKIKKSIVNTNGGVPDGNAHKQSYFITQETEGMLELHAVSKLVEGVYKDKNVVVVGACGMGKGSTQIQFKDFNNIKAPKINTAFTLKNGKRVSIGMTNIDKLVSVHKDNEITFTVPRKETDDYKNFYTSEKVYGEFFEKILREQADALKTYFGAVVKLHGNDKKFVIGLKSGFSMPFEASNLQNKYCNAILDLYTSGCANVESLINESDNDKLDIATMPALTGPSSSSSSSSFSPSSSLSSFPVSLSSLPPVVSPGIDLQNQNTFPPLAQ